jgi:hypothetical protein
VGPPIRSMNTQIRQARAKAQHQKPSIRPMTGRGWRDVATRRGVKAHETLLIPFGAQRAKRVCSGLDPKGHQYLPMETGGFLMVSTQTWDALLLPNPRSSCLKTDGDQYRNLGPVYGRTWYWKLCVDLHGEGISGPGSQRGSRGRCPLACRRMPAEGGGNR